MTVNIDEIRKQLNRLSREDLEQINAEITEKLEGYVGLSDFLNRCAEQRFADGLVCPHCGKKHIVKFGKARGKQRFRCKDCGKTFTPYTKTVFADSKLPLSVWLEYADCMSQQMTLRETSKKLRICLKTSFFMRHKILSALKTHIGIDHLGGVIEMDETFFAESFKGNHKNGNPDWRAPRDSGLSRQRGKQVDYRGISHEQVCISVAIDRNGGLVTVPAGKSRLTTKQLHSIYEGKIEKSSTICTDSHNAYKSFAKSVSADLVQIERGKHKKGVYHINHINALHSKLKLWMKRKYGISTKYIGNYMYWFNWSERNSHISRHRQGKSLIYDSISSMLILTREKIRETKPFVNVEVLL